MLNESWSIHFPEDFERADTYEQFERECKGWLAGTTVQLSTGEVIEFTFFDLVRLQQEMTDSTDGFFWEPNIVIVSAVRRDVLVQAIRSVMQSKDKTGARL